MGKRTLWIAEISLAVLVAIAMFLKFNEAALVGIGAFATLLGKLKEDV